MNCRIPVLALAALLSLTACSSPQQAVPSSPAPGAAEPTLDNTPAGGVPAATETATPTAGQVWTPPAPSAGTTGGGSSAPAMRRIAQDPPPWYAPSDVAARIEAAGLKALAKEALDYHLHAHLTVFHNGKPVEVPANLGIDGLGTFISTLHTHPNNGILHVESPETREFKLGQAFTLWGVSLEGAEVYVNGAKVTDGPGVVLAPNMAIAVVYGTPPAQIPSKYPAP